MNINFVGFLKGMSTVMFAAVVGTLLVSAYAVYSLESKRRLPHDFETVHFAIQDLHDAISELSTAPVLDKKDRVWRDVKAMAELHGVEFRDEEGDTSTEGSLYEGPLDSWRASLSGEAKSVFALAALAQKTHPVYLLDYAIGEGQAKLLIAIVGE